MPRKKVKRKTTKKVKKPPVKKVQQALQKLCPDANRVSIFHLAIAISNKYKYYLTSDPILLKKAKEIKKKFKMKLCKDPLEVQEMVQPKKKKSPMEFYI